MLNIECSLDLVLDAAHFYAAALGIDHYSADVEIVWLQNKDLAGYCGDCGDGSFEIGVEPDGLTTLQTLAHEFVHLEQYLTGAMRDLRDGRILFLDKVYAYDLSDDNHRLLPFEAEAYAQEEPLMFAYIKWANEQGKFK